MAYRAREELDLSHILSPEQVNEVVKLRKQGVTIQDLADRFDVHKNTILNIFRRIERQSK